MTLRTPRRRISPRTRKRYRAIKDFFKRAIGSSSQPDIEINSSIAINVTDLKHKIVGLEQQLSEVSRTCREFIYLDGSRKGSQSLVPTELKDERRDNLSAIESQAVETTILYKTSESHYRNSGSCESTPKRDSECDDVPENRMMNNYIINSSKSKDNNRKLQSKKKNLDIDQNLQNHYVQEKTNSCYSSSNLHSRTVLREEHHSNPDELEQVGRRNHKRDHNVHSHRNDVIHNEQLRRMVTSSYDRHAEDRAFKHSRNRQLKHESGKLDEDFIADIIKRQYKPVKMFGRRESDLSQFSEPMCRDREFTLNENLQEGTELCSCCYGGCHSPKHTRHTDNSDTRSICDTRLYSSKRNSRFKYRRAQADAYNDSELNDLIPVREKCSPKTRKKITLDNLATFNAYREVPPSPRTHKPRLNLKAQYYTESDDHIDFIRYGSRRVSPKSHRKYKEPIETFENEHSRARKHRHRKKLLSSQEQVHHQMEMMSSLQNPQTKYTEPNNTTLDTALNKTQETVSSSDKTDRALYEIKDILQTFLQEIKKEASSSGKSDVSAKMNENCIDNQNIPQTNVNVMPNSGHSFNNYNVPNCSSAPTPYIPPYPSACCYPIVPMYPMNCVQNGYVMPSHSFTCGTCANKTDVATDNKNKANNNGESETFASETDALIKEIYKMVAQSPTLSRKQDESQSRNYNSTDNRILTSRSAGRSTPVSKHDARVGTPRMQCYSKSCEAIGSKMISDTYNSGTNAVYSDTIFENLSLEATATTSSETDVSNERSEKNKGKNNKFTKVLRSFGLFKKKKDAIEEQNESESIIDVEIKERPPFRQEITNYMMHGQEYYRPPPVPQDYRHEYHHHPHEYQRPHNPAHHNYPPPEPYNDPRMQQPLQDQHPTQYHPSQYQTAPPTNSYGNYNQMQPQVPLCLKEIEVKSMGTQSERKMSFFRKIKEKIQPPVELSRTDGAKTCSTQTAQRNPGLFNWKNMQPKAMYNQNDPMAFSYKTQRNLAEGDKKMRNAMLKKMFYKRNPFSPRNLIMKTILGNDNFEPPKVYRPRMFL